MCFKNGLFLTMNVTHLFLIGTKLKCLKIMAVDGRFFGAFSTIIKMVVVVVDLAKPRKTAPSCCPSFWQQHNFIEGIMSHIIIDKQITNTEM